MKKTKKKEEVIDLTKPEKISDFHLKKMQGLVNDLNRSQIEIGSIEVRKHELIHNLSTRREDLTALQIEFEKEYGTFDVNINDGTINYPKEDGEANKED
tara:strand:+ start:715 stop:1011 length:297 start_codon:yes stop_codon:yes gene_type:complete